MADDKPKIDESLKCLNPGCGNQGLDTSAAKGSVGVCPVCNIASGTTKADQGEEEPAEVKLPREAEEPGVLDYDPVTGGPDPKFGEEAEPVKSEPLDPPIEHSLTPEDGQAISSFVDEGAPDSDGA